MSVKCWASVAGAGQYPFSPSQYIMLVGGHAHSAWRAAADSEMEVSAYFTSVHILSFGRAVTGTATDSEMEVSAISQLCVGLYRLVVGLWQAMLQTAK